MCVCVCVSEIVYLSIRRSVCLSVYLSVYLCTHINAGIPTKAEKKQALKLIEQIQQSITGDAKKVRIHEYAYPCVHACMDG